MKRFVFLVHLIFFTVTFLVQFWIIRHDKNMLKLFYFIHNFISFMVLCVKHQYKKQKTCIYLKKYIETDINYQCGIKLRLVWHVSGSVNLQNNCVR